PALGAGIRVRPLRPGATADPDAIPAVTAEVTAEMVTLDPDRRARIIAFIEGSARIPGDVKARMLTQLESEEVPAAMITRIESRMGG
ncbi:MAG: efflux transporter periplasmic adaptor subunit, partial [Jannaschia sp.]